MHNHCGLVSTFASVQYCFTYFGFQTYPGNYIFCFIDKISWTHLQVEYFITVIYTCWQKLKCKAKKILVIEKHHLKIWDLYRGCTQWHKQDSQKTIWSNWKEQLPKDKILIDLLTKLV